MYIYIYFTMLQIVGIPNILMLSVIDCSLESHVLLDFCLLFLAMTQTPCDHVFFSLILKAPISQKTQQKGSAWWIDFATKRFEEPSLLKLTLQALQGNAPGSAQRGQLLARYAMGNSRGISRPVCCSAKRVIAWTQGKPRHTS